jgi:RNA polymerase sigma-70 factor (sigma-E family)
MGVGAPERVTIEAFIAARGAALVRFAHALSGDRHLAEDLVQDVLVKSHRRWDTIRDNPEGYLRQAVVHELVSWRRRRSSAERPTWPLPDGPGEPDSGFDDRDEMWAALARLPSRQRAVLVLRFWEGLSDREIAILMSCAEGTVRSLASRATASLRGRLTPTAAAVLDSSGEDL